MKHPQREAWVPYLTGEAAAETRNELAAHLRDCAECAAQVAAWERTMRALDAWKLPRHRPRSRVAPPILKWAIAAAVVLSLGFGAGRLSAPAAGSLKALRAQVENAARTSTEFRLQERQELGADLEAALAANRRQLTNEVHAQVAAMERQLLANMDQTARALNATSLESRESLRALGQALQDARLEDREATTSLVRRLKEDEAANLLALRKDLETVASFADDQLQQARQRILQLANYTQPDHPANGKPHSSQ